MKNTLMIVNPVSGRKEIIFKLNEVISILKSNDYVLDLRFTTEKSEAESFVKNFAKDKDLIICAGGDGTLNEVVNGVLKNNFDIPIAYIPCGTTNDFATSLDIPKDVIKATKDIVKGSVHEIDAGEFKGNYFLYVAAFGAFTQSSYSTPQDLKNVFGHFAYVINGMTEIPKIKKTYIKITTEEGECVEGEYFLGAITNTRSIGGMLKLDKRRVDMSDGYFEVLLIGRPYSFEDLSNIIDFFDKESKSESVQGNIISFLHTKAITVETQKPQSWSIDGEKVKLDNCITFRNVNKAVKLILRK